jgi:hypothetical protein
MIIVNWKNNIGGNKMKINDYINTDRIKKAINQTKNDLKDSFEGTVQVIQEQKAKKDTNATQEADNDQRTNKVDIEPKREVVEGFETNISFKHQNSVLMLNLLVAWNRLLNQYIPKSCDNDWRDTSVKGRDAISVFLIAPQGLSVKLDLNPQMFANNDDPTDIEALVTSMLKIVPKLLVEQVSELELKEQRGHDFADYNDLDSKLKLKNLHDDEDYFIRIAQAMALISSYPDLKSAINLHESEKAEIPAFNVKEEGLLIKQYKEFINKYNLTEFYPSHVTYSDSAAIRHSVNLDLKIARPNGVLVRTISIYPKTIINSTCKFDDILATEFLKMVKKLVSTSKESLIDKIKNKSDQVYEEDKLAQLVEDDLVFYKAMADDVLQNMQVN